MRKDDRGRPRDGGILVDDAAHRAPAAAVPAQPGGSRPSAPGGNAARDMPGAAGTAAETAPGEAPAGAPPSGSAADPARAGTAADPARTGTAAEPARAGTAAEPAPGEAPAEAAAGEAPAGPAPGDGDGRSVAVRQPGTVARPAPAGKEPSWGRVLATTISLWASRRLRRLGIGQGRPPRWGAGYPSRPQASRARARAAGRWWPLVALVLAVVILGLVALLLSGALGTSQGTRASSGNSGSGGTSSFSAADTWRASCFPTVTRSRAN